VGNVRAVYWPGDAGLATSLAEYAERARPWPGIPVTEPFPITVVVTRSDARFDSLTRGRLPDWTGAAAFPRAGTIVLRVSGDPFATLHHELAHLVLSRVAGRVPLWFAEGYAVHAAGHWGVPDALALNWQLLRGRPPGFATLEGELRAGPAHARAAYVLAATAVRYLERVGGVRGLQPLIAALATHGDFERAVRAVHLTSLEDLEAGWHRDLRHRYGWLLVGTSLTAFWGMTGLGVGALWWRRRRRDRNRRAALDDGWEVPGETEPNA
jgi:hypothetical protein